MSLIDASIHTNCQICETPMEVMYSPNYNFAENYCFRITMGKKNHNEYLKNQCQKCVVCADCTDKIADALEALFDTLG